MTLAEGRDAPMGGVVEDDTVAILFIEERDANVIV